MKATIRQCIKALGVLDEIKERRIDNEMIKAVIIPSEKSSTGYWLGRFEDKLIPVNKAFIKQHNAIIAEFGALKTIKKSIDGIETEIPLDGQFEVKPELYTKYNEALDTLLDVEEDINLEPFEFSLFEGIAFPASFIMGITPFLKEPSKK